MFLILLLPDAVATAAAVAAVSVSDDDGVGDAAADGNFVGVDIGVTGARGKMALVKPSTVVLTVSQSLFTDKGFS